jgi:DNA-directed RNA polymerase subunit M/transcription elongation factor TFIIS
MIIKVKKIMNTGAGEAGITCYKCKKNRASYYLTRESDGRSVDVPMCTVCLSAYLNYLDDKIIKYHYDLVHEGGDNDKR